MDGWMEDGKSIFDKRHPQVFLSHPINRGSCVSGSRSAADWYTYTPRIRAPVYNTLYCRGCIIRAAGGTTGRLTTVYNTHIHTVALQGVTQFLTGHDRATGTSLRESQRQVGNKSCRVVSYRL